MVIVKVWHIVPLLSPLLVVVGGILYALFIQCCNQWCQDAAPCGSKPVRVSKPFYDGRAYRIVCADEETPCCRARKAVVSETPKSPDLRTIIGAVNAGGNIAALAVAVVVGTKRTGITGAGGLSPCVPVVITAESARIAMACFAAVGVVMIIAAKDARVRSANLVPFGIVIGIAAEGSGLAAAYLPAALIIMVDGTESTLYAFPVFRHVVLLPGIRNHFSDPVITEYHRLCTK